MKIVVSGSYLLIALALMLGACASTQDSVPTFSPANKPPIKIGHILSLTGPQATANSSMAKGFDLAMELTRYQAAGRKIEVIREDDGGKAELAVTKARKLIEQDNVVAIIGPTLPNS
jgi:branched-chain amino acid transport system substrate-binding protein